MGGNALTKQEALELLSRATKSNMTSVYLHLVEQGDNPAEALAQVIATVTEATTNVELVVIATEQDPLLKEAEEILKAYSN